MNTEKSNDKVTSRVPKYLYLIISAITALLIGAYIITVFITRFSAIAFVMPFCAFTLACVAFFGYKVLPKWLKGVLCAGMSFFLATYIAFLSYSLATAASSKARLDALPKDEQLTVMIFGCYVRGEEPGRTLTTRLDAALSLLKRYQNADCIVSGGQGSNEAISEAEAMRRYLVSRGIAEERITLEDRSTNTSENLEYTFAILTGSESDGSAASTPGSPASSNSTDSAQSVDTDGRRLVGVSSEYHLPRIRMLSRALGREIETYPAYDANIGNTLIYTLREYMGVAKLWLGV
ncbi:MAG: YdcF family protein [Christensenellales bacterium]